MRGQLVNAAMDQFSAVGRFQDIVDAGRPEAAFDQAVFVVDASSQNAQGKGLEGMQAGATERH